MDINMIWVLVKESPKVNWSETKPELLGFFKFQLDEIELTEGCSLSYDDDMDILMNDEEMTVPSFVEALYCQD